MLVHKCVNAIRKMFIMLFQQNEIDFGLSCHTKNSFNTVNGPKMPTYGEMNLKFHNNPQQVTFTIDVLETLDSELEITRTIRC